MSSSPAFHRGVFTLSFDFELVWGSRDLVQDLGPLLQEARATRSLVFDHLLSTLGRTGLHATWATVGHLFLGGAQRVDGVLHPHLVPPHHPWHPRPWFADVPAGTEAQHPEYYGRSLVTRVRDAGHEVGSHSFSHPVFSDPGCARQTADTDLAACVAAAADLGITLRSLVFPRNLAGHLDVVAAHGFTCWRGIEPVWHQQRGVPRPVARLGHLADVARAAEPPTVMPQRSEHGLWSVPASASFLPVHGVRGRIPIERRVSRCLRGLEAAARDRRIFHLYLHPINLATSHEAMLAGMDRVLAHAARLRDAGKLDVLTMGQVADRATATAAGA